MTPCILAAASPGEVRVAVGGVDRGAALARLGRALDVAGTERQRLAAGAREHDGAGIEARY